MQRTKNNGLRTYLILEERKGLMFKKILLLAVLIAVGCFFNAQVWADAQSVISITGEVKQPLYMSMDDLKKFDSACVRLNEVSKDKSFHGVFYFHGPSLANRS